VVTHPEVAARVALATGVAQHVKELVGAVGADEDLSAGAPTRMSRLEAAPLLVTKQCTGHAALVGPVRAGDVEFAHQMLGRGLLGSSPAEVARALAGFGEDVRQRDLLVVVRSLQLVAGAGAAGSLVREVQALTATFQHPWDDPDLNVPVRPGAAAAGRTRHGHPRPLPGWFTVLLAVALLALVVFAVPALT
jgi:hypothetical protein